MATAPHLEKPAEMRSLAEFLKVQMARKNVDTKTLSRATGISITGINALKRGEGNPQLGTLLTLARYFNTSIDHMLNRATSMDQTSTPLRVPIFSLQTARHRTDDRATYHITIEQPATLQDDDLFGIELHNNVMAPFYENGTVFIISPKTPHCDGDLVLIDSGNVTLNLRRIFEVGGQYQFQTIGLNTAPQMYPKYKIVGVVLQAIQLLHR